MKRQTKFFLGVATVFLGVTIMNLRQAGEKYGWGPFAYLHTWDADVEEILSAYPKGHQHEIIFYGASNFSLWKDLEDDFSEYNVQNHAFGGSRDSDLQKFGQDLVVDYKPDIVVFQTGSNDYVGLKGSTEEIVKTVMAKKVEMFYEFHQQIPEAHFIIMGGLLLPGRKEYLELTQRINRELQAWTEDMDYLTFVNSESLTYNGQSFREELFLKDKIHLNKIGQLQWRDNFIKPALDKIITEQSMQHLKDRD